jgi:hypothetical protein
MAWVPYFVVLSYYGLESLGRMQRLEPILYRLLSENHPVKLFIHELSRQRYGMEVAVQIALMVE